MRIITSAPASAQVAAALTTAQVMPNALTPTTAAILALPGTNRFEQRNFLVQASGYATTAGVLNVTVTLYSGTSLVPGNNTVIWATTATAQNTVSAPWFVEAELVLDTVSGKLHGIAHGVVNNTLSAHSALTNVVTALNGSSEPVMNFVVGVTFSVANVANIGVMKQLIAGF